MKLKGFDAFLNSEGKGIIGCMGAIILVVVILFMGIKLGPVYYSNFIFEEDVKSVVSRASSHAQNNEAITKDILALAKKNNINLTTKNAHKNIKIERYAGQIHVEIQYFVHVDFLVIEKNLKFEVKTSSFVAT